MTDDYAYDLIKILGKTNQHLKSISQSLAALVRSEKLQGLLPQQNVKKQRTGLVPDVVLKHLKGKEPRGPNVNDVFRTTQLNRKRMPDGKEIVRARAAIGQGEDEIRRTHSQCIDVTKIQIRDSYNREFSINAQYARIKMAAAKKAVDLWHETYGKEQG